MKLTILKREVFRDEEGSDIQTLVEVESEETGEKLKFHHRNIFDVGNVINPAYAVVAGARGGIAVRNATGEPLHWETHSLGRCRDLTPFETECIAYIATNLNRGIRM